MQITKLDLVSVPARDAERLAEFYAGALGLRRDEHSRREVWAGDTCISIWQPDEHGIEFEPQRNGHLALHVEDVEAARKEFETKGVEFLGDTLDTSVCHMAIFRDPDGNDLMLHHRYKPYA